MDDSGAVTRPELKLPGPCLWLVTLASAGRFFAPAADGAAAFPTFSEAEAWRFASDDVVDLLTPAALAIDAVSELNKKKIEFEFNPKSGLFFFPFNFWEKEKNAAFNVNENGNMKKKNLIIKGGIKWLLSSGEKGADLNCGLIWTVRSLSGIRWERTVWAPPGAVFLNRRGA